MSQLTSLDQFFVRNLTSSCTEKNDSATLSGTASADDPKDELRRSAILFNAEALAHTVLRLLKALSFEARLGIPKTDLELLTLFQTRGYWGLAEGRRLRQFLELRNLSTRNLDQIDFAGIQELLLGREEWLSLMRKLSQQFSSERPSSG